MDRLRGFSLLELIIVVAIAAILAAIAVTTYGRYVLRAHRADAHHALMTIANGQERWYATYNRYADDLSEFGYAMVALSQHGYYELALAVDGDAAQSFTATATPLNAQAGDACGILAIDGSGNKTPGPEDEQANANGRCW
ncbi:type IV pilin protein [Dyella flava]|uniref:Type IV pilin protein n=1 Tax=Dyella flava TaxID=1920170 RepID=A0ABS2KB70_9GAMM|nr:type IV pilin protein [Dyella flava]MBM7127613.1 type IV pilin protein [Dyella flava]GLQ51212.1 type IV pilin [Dyella flava]